MIDKKRKTKAGATKLKEDELKQAQGGWSWGETSLNYNKASPTLQKVRDINPVLQKVQKV